MNNIASRVCIPKATYLMRPLIVTFAGVPDITSVGVKVSIRSEHPLDGSSNQAPSEKKMLL